MEMDTVLNNDIAYTCLIEEILIELDFEDWLEENHVYTGNLNIHTDRS